MELVEFEKIFFEESKKNNIEFDQSKIQMFYTYMKDILEWNEKINLTAITDEKMFIVKHFIDSLTVNKYIKDCNTIIDIGTGAGFPGMPLKIMNPDKKIVLVDSINKKLNVVREISQKMNIKEIEIIHSRAEELAQNNSYRESFDVATTRAVSNITTILEYMLPFIKVGGYAICMKGPNFEDELKEAQNAISILGGSLEKIETINVDEELERNIIIIKKVKKTPIKFPRGQGKPLKEPIR